MGKILSNFDLKKIDFELYFLKNYGKNDPTSPDFKERKIQITRFL
jgi:hypothetical protein